MQEPLNYVDVTGQGAKRVIVQPLFNDQGTQIVAVLANPASPGNLDQALVVATLADASEPAALAKTLAAKAGGSASVTPMMIGGQQWYRFPAATGSVGGLAMLTRFAERNILIEEGGQGDHLNLTAMAASLAAS